MVLRELLLAGGPRAGPFRSTDLSWSATTKCSTFWTHVHCAPCSTGYQGFFMRRVSTGRLTIASRGPGDEIESSLYIFFMSGWSSIFRLTQRLDAKGNRG